jgi:hypothetical protein
MKGKLHIYYDEEGDFLEINVGNNAKGDFKNLGEGIFERVDGKTKQVTGVAIHGFKKRTEGLKDVNISLPVNIELSS